MKKLVGPAFINLLGDENGHNLKLLLVYSIDVIQTNTTNPT